jgi:hypothetical protein
VTARIIALSRDKNSSSIFRIPNAFTRTYALPDVILAGVRYLEGLNKY